MTYVLVLLFALLIGVVAGLRALTAPAVVAWAGGARLDRPRRHLVGMGRRIRSRSTVLTILAVGELVTDQLPKTPSRRCRRSSAPGLLTGAFAGAVHRPPAPFLPHVHGRPSGPALIGAVLGTLGGCRGAPEARRGQRRT